MRAPICLALAGMLAIGAVAAAEPGLTWNGELGLERAYASGQFDPVLTRVDARAAGQYQGEHCAARLALRWRADEHLAPALRHSGELREASVECRQNAWLMKLGRQVVVWGKADNFRVLDAVHPFDYREFLLDDKEAARRPLAMVKLEGQMGERDALEMLLIAERRADLLPQGGERFAALFPQAALERLAGPRRAASGSLFEQLQYGAKWEHTGQQLGYTINALERWSPQDRYAPDPQGAVLARQPYRQPMLGGSADLAVAAWVVRGEAMYTPRLYLPAAGAYQRYRQLAWVAGVDRGIGEFFVSGQLFETRSLGGALEPLGGRVQRLASLSATRSFLQDRLKARVFAARDLREHGSWLSASLERGFESGLEWTAGLDIFNGPAASAFGQIKQQSRIKVGIKLRR